MLYVLAAFLLFLLVAVMVLRPLLGTREAAHGRPGGGGDTGSEVTARRPGATATERVGPAPEPGAADDLEALIADRRKRMAGRDGEVDR